MKIRTTFFLSIVTTILLISGCQNVENVEKEDVPKEAEAEEQETEKVSAEKSGEPDTSPDTTVEAPPLPTTLEELEELPSGFTQRLSYLDERERSKINELTAGLPDITDESNTEELDRYYEAILSVFQQDYTGPGDLIKNLKFQAIGSPEVEDPRYQFKENLNVMVILDASGSMANYEGSQTRMEAAKTAIKNFIKGLPEDANVGLRIYGHEGTGSKEDKARSCSSSELIYPIGKYNSGNFDQALTKAKPAGWTPIGLALNEAQKDLADYEGDINTNIIYLVSDGISTCEDDPVGAAKALYNSDITPIVNVIGFNVDNEGQKQLQEVAKATEGSYQNVSDAQGLQDQLNEASKVAEKWERWKSEQKDWLKYYQINNDLDIFSYMVQEEQKRLDEFQQIDFTLQYFQNYKNMFSQEGFDYLRNKNSEYHGWIKQEYSELQKDLKALNNANYTDAVKELEEKYLQNTNTP